MAKGKGKENFSIIQQWSLFSFAGSIWASALLFYLRSNPMFPTPEEISPLVIGSSNYKFFISPESASLIAATVLFMSIVQRILDPLRGDADNSVQFSLISVQIICCICHVFIGIGMGVPFDNAFGRLTYLARYLQWNIAFPLMLAVVESVDYDERRSNFDILMQLLSVALGSLASTIIPSSLKHFGVFMIIPSYGLLYYPCHAVYRRYKKMQSLQNKQKRTQTHSLVFISDVEKSKRSLLLYIITTFECFVYVTIHCSGILGIISNTTENIAFTMTDVISKSLFSAAISHNFSFIQTQVRKLQSAHDSSRKFLRYVFHEIRVPLNSLVLGIDVLKKDLSEYEELSFEDILEVMEDSATTMSTVLNEVLSFQKIEEGKFEMELRIFNLQKAIKRSATAFKAALDIKGMNIEVQLGEGLPRHVIGDASRIRQVFQNLVSNSIKFSPENTTITVRVQRCGDQKLQSSSDLCWIQVLVIDQGVGISDEDKQKLFQPYIQIRPGDLQDGRGTGLGLSICREIVEAHGGEIGVTSTAGKGAEFFFQIPFKVPKQDTAPSPKAQSPTSKSISSLDNPLDKIPKSRSLERIPRRTPLDQTLTPTVKPIEIPEQTSEAKMQETPKSPPSPTPLSPIHRRCTSEDSSIDSFSWGFEYHGKVLVVDDVRANRRLLEALEKIRAAKGQYDIIFLDNVMPRMSGVECARKIREMKMSVTIVGITGNALEEDIKEFKEAGANHVLLKPIRIDSLKNVIEELSSAAKLA
jgi:signal transduction histidine kinase